MYSAYQIVQENSTENGKNNTIDVNTAQQNIALENDNNEEPD